MRIASRNDDSCPGILSLYPANRGAGILIRRSRNRAGIHHDHGGLRRTASANHAALLELAFERGTIRLRGTATEVLYVVSRHVSMVAQTGATLGENVPCPSFDHGQLRTVFRSVAQAVAAVLRP